MPQIERFDLVVIGSGPGGEKGAAQAAYFGKRVALVERSAEVGGASVHTGTLPSKTLREAALYLTGFRRRELYGMSLKLDRKKSLRQLVGRLKDVTDRQTHQIHRNFDRHAVALVAGVASFEDAKTVAVRNAAGELVRRLSADVVLIATGSSPTPPRGISIDDPDVVDSDRILNLDRVPKSLTVVGGGVIGTEYACLFAALGTRVVAGRRPRPAARRAWTRSSRPSSSSRLERMGARDPARRRRRVDRARSRAPHECAPAEAEVRAARSAPTSCCSPRAAPGTRRGSNLEAIGVEVNERGHIRVGRALPDDDSRDLRGRATSSAFRRSRPRPWNRAASRCATRSASPSRPACRPFLPYGIYSVPEISTIGPTEQELQEKGIDYEVGRARFENNARGQITGDSDGMIKLLFDPTTRRLLAAHILGEHATELVHIPMFVMAAGGTIDAFIEAVFNFPTLAEAFKYAAYDGLQRLARREAPRVDGRAREVASDPATRPWFVGVDLSRSGATAGRPAAVCVMDRFRRCRFATWSYDAGGVGLLSEESERDGFVLALAVGREGVDGILNALRGHGHAIAGEGPEHEAEVVLARPPGLWRSWARGQRISGPAARRKRYEILRAQGLELPVGVAAIHDDQLDAAAAAYAAYLWATKQIPCRGAELVPAI